jgi:ribosomal protein S18 acetylase RimI-like enzyme
VLFKQEAAVSIEFKVNKPISVDQFIELLAHTSLGARRPLNDRNCLQGMIDHANLTVTAWMGDQLIGIARSVTDFHFACYLSDLAVHQNFQKQGIGKQLQRLTQAQLKPTCHLILLAAPQANDYYGAIGYSHNPRCWVLESGATIKED